MKNWGKRWSVVVPGYDPNLEIWSLAECNAGKRELLIELVEVIDIKFEPRIIFAFLMVEFLPIFDEDLICLAL